MNEDTNNEENILKNEKEEASQPEQANENSEEISTEDVPVTPVEIIEKLNQEVQDLKDQRLRAAAELENFRKRAEKDQSDALKYGISNFAKEIININLTTKN